MSAKQLLESYGNKTREIEALQNKISEMRVLSERCTSMLHLAPGGNAYNDSRLEEFIARIDEMERRLGSLWEERGGIFIDIMNLLCELPSEMSRKVLTMRYIEGKTYDDIAAETMMCKTLAYNKTQQGVREAEVILKKRTQENENECE